jgi:uncharacterized protein (DUF885 family)
MLRDRFGLLLISLALTLVAGCARPADSAGTSRRTARELDQLMAAIAQTELAADPELATRLGVSPEAAGYRFAGALTDRSQAAYERQRLTRFESLDALMRAARPADGGSYASHLDTLQTAFETTQTLSVSGHGRIRLGAAFPYAADHLHGVYRDVPELLIGAQPLQTRDDARDYVSRLAQFADRLDDERRRLGADARAGVAPPRAVLDRMRADVDRLGAGPAETHALVQTLAGAIAGIAALPASEQQTLTAMATDLVRREILPAYARYAADLAALDPVALNEPGVWQLPDGDRFYADVLAASADSTLSAEALHARGHAEVESLSAELDAALIAAGLTNGSVGARLAELARQPGQIAAPTEEGRAALMARMQSHIARAEAQFSREFSHKLSTRVAVQAVAVTHAAVAQPIAYRAAAAPGRRPAMVEVNLADTRLWPDYTLATVMFNQALPGHHAEKIYADDRAKLPLIREMIDNPGYREGWGAYAETLADDMGLYAGDPLGRIGYLQSVLFRAARLVTDTGIHRMRWTRAQAVDYLVSVTGQPADLMAAEVDAASAAPGQAAAFWIGRQRLLDLRERSVRVLGPKFDRAAFHEVILTGGPRPLGLVERDVEGWYSAQVKPEN